MVAVAYQETSAEVKSILKQKYEDCSALAKTAHDTEDLDEEDTCLSILGKRARNSLSKLARHVAEPAGGWYDKQCKLHSHHAEQAKRLGELLDNTWFVMDLFQSPAFLESMNEYANTHKEFHLKVITAQDKLHNLLDEFDWEAFTLKIKHG